MSTLSDYFRSTHVCPWWMIYTFDNSLRRIVQKPEGILGGLVQPGDHCLDIGCGYGFFTIPMAKMVAPSGTVTAADLQPQMLAGVKRRAEKSGVIARIRFHRVDILDLNFDNIFDFVLVFWMAHEVPDQGSMFYHVRMSIKQGGLLLIAEPKVHVSKAAFIKTIEYAEKAGFQKISEPSVRFSRAVLLKKS